MSSREFEEVPGTYERLIMTFPLNGYTQDGEKIFILDNEHGLTADVEFKYVRQMHHGARFNHDTLEDAIRVALNNSGWGQFRITDVTDR